MAYGSYGRYGRYGWWLVVWSPKNDLSEAIWWFPDGFGSMGISSPGFMMIDISIDHFLVGGIPTPLKNDGVCQLG